MVQNPREALSRLVAALEHHLDLAENSDVVRPAVLDHGEDMVRDAFFTYDDALFTAYGLELPFEILEDEFWDDEDVDAVEEVEDDDLDEFDLDVEDRDGVDFGQAD